MSIPIISTISPSTAPTSGRSLVEVLGDGFRLPAGVRVLFGGRAATDVRVYATGRLTCLAPIGDEGLQDVVVENVDADGAPIPGEQAIAPSAFSYLRPSLTVEADLTRLVRVLLRELKRQVIENVVLTVHTDFDAGTGAELHLATIAMLPGLVLVGPELNEDRFFSQNELPAQQDGATAFSRRRAPYTVDLSFSVVGVSHHTIELLNLMAATHLFFHSNKYLELARDPSNPDLGSVRYEMDLARDGALKTTTTPNESNVRSFSGRFVVRGFDLEELAGFVGESVIERGTVTDNVSIESPLPLASPSPSGEGSQS